jgi:hypothetical protein
MRSILRASLIVALSVILLTGAPSTQPATAQKPLLPQPIAVLAMVRSTLIAVDQASKTGNYTVLRDLAGPGFRDANDASKLSKVFAMLTTQGIDLLPVTVVEPQYKTPPTVTPKNMLYIYGTFPIAPRAVDFEILYEMNNGRWRLFGLLISPARPAGTTTAPAVEPTPPQ